MRLCQIEGCNLKHQARGFCLRHYAEKKSAGLLKIIRPKIKNRICKITECGLKYYAGDYCKFHYNKHIKGTLFKSKQIELKLKNKPGIPNKGLFAYPNHHIMKKNRLLKFQQVDFKCEKCGDMAKYIHHIDRSKDNHDIQNLMAICAKCHAVLHNGGWGKPHKYAEEIYELSKKTGIAIVTILKYKNNPDSVTPRIKHLIENS